MDNMSNEILFQAKQAAADSAAKLKRKYANISSSEGDIEYIGPKIVCLDCSTQGEVSAVECPEARSAVFSQNHSLPNQNSDSIKTEENVKPRPTQNISYPPFLVDLLTKSKPMNSFKLDDYSTSKQKEILDDLHKLKYNLDEPIAAAIHGPLTIFSPLQLAQLSEVYGGDPSVIEYAISLLKFVQPLGRWARRWVTKRLDAATDGLHSQAVYALQPQCTNNTKPTADNSKPEVIQSWLDVVDITIDPPTPISDEINEENIEPCLIDLLNDYDTVISCSGSTPPHNEHVSPIFDVEELPSKNKNTNSVDTSYFPVPIDVPMSTDSCTLSLCNTAVSNSEPTVEAVASAPTISSIPQQNSSAEVVNSKTPGVMFCDPVSSPVLIPTSEDLISPHADISLVVDKPSGDEILITECVSSVKAADSVVRSNSPDLDDLTTNNAVLTKSEQVPEALKDNSTSVLKTALSGSSYSLNNSHDRMVVQNKGIIETSEDSTKSPPTRDCLAIVPATGVQYSLFLDSHLITHKKLPISTAHDPVNQNDSVSCTEVNLLADCQSRIPCMEICANTYVDMDASSSSPVDTDNENSFSTVKPSPT
ncbi:unnamed protein product [Heterobilharzia americana]|nr:unnamed protein product [Heterobilharzia americana]